MSQIITFDVGGQVYRVSTTTLNLYPNTVLAKSASKEWKDDDSSAIFMDRNGFIFSQVLDYMRNNGSVSLPSTVTKKAFLAEMEYYGFDDVDESLIDDSTTRASIEAGSKATIQNIAEVLVDCSGAEVTAILLKKYTEKKPHYADYQKFSIKFKASDIKSELSQVIIDTSNKQLKKVGLFISGFSSRNENHHQVYYVQLQEEGEIKNESVKNIHPFYF